MGKSVIKGEELQNYLFLEGKNDFHVICSLLEHHKIPERFKVQDKEGIDRLLEAFEVGLQLREGCIGIIIDADTDLTASWQRVTAILKGSGYNNVPANPMSEGTVLKEEERSTVGIWLMPNNKIPGMLEDFVSLLVPRNDLLWPITNDVIQKVKVVEEGRRFRDVHESKARIHTWLAWQEEPGKPMGQAITACYLDASAPYAQQFMNWIRKLFNLESA